MSIFGLSGGERGLVVFLIWQSLPYGIRMPLSFLLIAAGVAVQIVTESFLLGVAPILLGNLLLLVRGYDNRVDLKGFAPGASWERVGRERLDEVLALDRNIRRWDMSILDATNYAGFAVAVIIAGGLGVLAWFLDGLARILVLDALILLLPHWVTGVRRILRFPKLVVRAETLASVIDGAGDLIGDNEVDILMLLKGKDEQRVPDDVKFRLSFADQEQDFLGLYGQVVVNDVQGKSYPYFYVVMVARKGYGLETAFDAYSPPQNIVAEFDTEEEVEFIVIRQKTTKTSGYHTKPVDAMTVFIAGYGLAEKVAVKRTAST